MTSSFASDTIMAVMTPVVYPPGSRRKYTDDGTPARDKAISVSKSLKFLIFASCFTMTVSSLFSPSLQAPSQTGHHAAVSTRSLISAPAVSYRRAASGASGSWPYAPWLLSVWKLSGATVYPNSTTPLQLNGNPTSLYPNPAASIVGYGPCPKKGRGGIINPQVKLPVTSILSLAFNGFQESNSVYLTKPIALKKGSTLFSWATEFYFQTGRDGCTEDVWSAGGVDTDTCAAGFVFTIQSYKTTALGGSGGDLGYGQLQSGADDSVKKSIGVEFDMRLSTRYNDPDGNHIAYVKNGVPKHDPAKPQDTAFWPRAFNDGNIKRAVIVYDKGLLNVYLGDTPVDYPKLALSYRPAALPKELDLSKVFVGFTASTGITPNTMALRIYNWRFFYANPSTANPGPAVPTLPVVAACPPPPPPPQPPRPPPRPPQPPHPSPPPRPSPPPPKPKSAFFVRRWEHTVYHCRDALNIDWSTCDALYNSNYFQEPTGISLFNGKAYIASKLGIAICNDPTQLQDCVLKVADSSISFVSMRKVVFYNGVAYIYSFSWIQEFTVWGKPLIVCNNAASLSGCFTPSGFTAASGVAINNLAYIAIDSYNVNVPVKLQICWGVTTLTNCVISGTFGSISDLRFKGSSLLITDMGKYSVYVCRDLYNNDCISSQFPNFPYIVAADSIGDSVFIVGLHGLLICQDLSNPLSCQPSPTFSEIYLADILIADV